MCTVSVIPWDADADQDVPGARGFRLVTNRDESPARARASAPEWREVAGTPGRSALSPTDPVSGGTWVSATTAGLGLCLLNGNPRPYPRLPPKDDLVSRGTIIPSLEHHDTARRALEDLRSRDLCSFAPFRLLLLDVADGLPSLIDFRWDRERLEVRDGVPIPACFASSGLGDGVVRERLPLFDELVAGDPSDAAQDAYHTHRWADRPEVSVMMRRDGAETISITTLVVARSRDGRVLVRMNYEHVSHDFPAAELPRRSPMVRR